MLGREPLGEDHAVWLLPSWQRRADRLHSHGYWRKCNYRQFGALLQRSKGCEKTEVTWSVTKAVFMDTSWYRRC